MSTSKRISGKYSEASNKDDLYAEIQARRADREGEENANLFEGINSSSGRGEMEAALEADDKAGDGKDGKTTGTGKSTEGAGIGTPEAPKGKPIPDSVKIKRQTVTEFGTKTTEGASVQGNQSLLVIDVLQSRPVDVFLIEAKAFRKDLPQDPLVFVQGAVSSELLPYAQAKSRFACKKDGTVIYNSHGFDDVPATADFDLVDIVKLIEHNHGKKPKADKPPTD